MPKGKGQEKHHALQSQPTCKKLQCKKLQSAVNKLKRACEGLLPQRSHEKKQSAKRSDGKQRCGSKYHIQQTEKLAEIEELARVKGGQKSKVFTFRKKEKKFVIEKRSRAKTDLIGRANGGLRSLKPEQGTVNEKRGFSRGQMVKYAKFIWKYMKPTKVLGKKKVDPRVNPAAGPEQRETNKRIRFSRNEMEEYANNVRDGFLRKNGKKVNSKSKPEVANTGKASQKAGKKYPLRPRRKKDFEKKTTSNHPSKGPEHLMFGEQKTSQEVEQILDLDYLIPIGETRPAAAINSKYNMDSDVLNVEHSPFGSRSGMSSNSPGKDIDLLDFEEFSEIEKTDFIINIGDRYEDEIDKNPVSKDGSSQTIRGSMGPHIEILKLGSKS